jgi:hypothetical protein
MYKMARHPFDALKQVLVIIGAIAVLGGALLAIAAVAGHNSLFNFSINIDGASINEPPPRVTGELQAQTVTLSDTSIVLSCSGVLEAGVSTFAKQGINYVDTSVIHKVWFEKAAVCGSNNTLLAQAVLRGYSKKHAEVITAVEATVPPLFPEVTGTDMINAENCINVAKGESRSAIQQAVNKFELAKYQGHEPACNFGFALTALLGSSSSASIFGLSQMEAQAGFELEPYTNPVIAGQEANIAKAMQYELRGMYPGANVSLRYEVLPSELEQEEERIALFAPEAAEVFNSLKFQESKGQLQAVISGPGGSILTIDFLTDVAFSGPQLAELNKYAADELSLYEVK